MVKWGFQKEGLVPSSLSGFLTQVCLLILFWIPVVSAKEITSSLHSTLNYEIFSILRLHLSNINVSEIWLFKKINVYA